MKPWGLGSCDFQRIRHQWQTKCYRRYHYVFDVFGGVCISHHPAFHVSQRCYIFRFFWSWVEIPCWLHLATLSASYLRFAVDGLRPVFISVLFEPPCGDCCWEIAPIFLGWMIPWFGTRCFVWSASDRRCSFVGCYGDHWRVVAVFGIERMEFTHKSSGCTDAYRMLICADWTWRFHYVPLNFNCTSIVLDMFDLAKSTLVTPEVEGMILSHLWICWSLGFQAMLLWNLYHALVNSSASYLQEVYAIMFGS